MCPFQHRSELCWGEFPDLEDVLTLGLFHRMSTCGQDSHPDDVPCAVMGKRRKLSVQFSPFTHEDAFNVMVLRGVDSVVFILPPRRHPLSHLELMSKDQSNMEGKLGVSGTDL